MSAIQPRIPWQRVASMLWFPVFFAIGLPLTFETAFHQPTPHNVPIAVVGNPDQVRLVTGALDRARAGGFEVRTSPSAMVAVAAVRGRTAAAASVAGSSGTLYTARAASAIRASYLQGVFTRIATERGTQPVRVVDLVPLASGDGGTGIFFFVFPLMMAGLITAIVLLQLPTWGIGGRVIVVAAVGAIGALAAYLTVVEVYGQLMVGAAPLLKQYFLPVSLTAALILSVPSSGGTVPPDLLPGLFRDLSYALPLARGVKITRSIAYFHGAGIAQATLVMGVWAAVAVGAVVAASLRRPSGARTAAASHSLSLLNPKTAGSEPAPTTT